MVLSNSKFGSFTYNSGRIFTIRATAMVKSRESCILKMYASVYCFSEEFVMENRLFRRSGIERVSSPEQLNDYIKVSNPGVWMLLSAVVVLLAGVCVWGIFGRLDTKIPTAGICSNGTFTCYVSEEKIGNIKSGMTVNVEGSSLSVSDISAKPVEVNDGMDRYLMHLGGFFEGEWLYEITADAGIPDGTYKAEIVTKSVSPMSFILN